MAEVLQNLSVNRSNATSCNSSATWREALTRGGLQFLSFNLPPNDTGDVFDVILGGKITTEATGVRFYTTYGANYSGDYYIDVYEGTGGADGAFTLNLAVA